MEDHNSAAPDHKVLEPPNDVIANLTLEDSHKFNKDSDSLKYALESNKMKESFNILMEEDNSFTIPKKEVLVPPKNAIADLTKQASNMYQRASKILKSNKLKEGFDLMMEDVKSAIPKKEVLEPPKNAIADLTKEVSNMYQRASETLKSNKLKEGFDFMMEDIKSAIPKKEVLEPPKNAIADLTKEVSNMYQRASETLKSKKLKEGFDFMMEDIKSAIPKKEVLEPPKNAIADLTKEASNMYQRASKTLKDTLKSNKLKEGFDFMMADVKSAVPNKKVLEPPKDAITDLTKEFSELIKKPSIIINKIKDGFNLMVDDVKSAVPSKKVLEPPKDAIADLTKEATDGFKKVSRIFKDVFSVFF